MEFLVIFLGWFVGMLFIVGTSKAISYVKRKQLEAGRKAIGKDSGPGPDFYPLTYNPHYTRALEAEQGLKVDTQCEFTDCTICYWKARNRVNATDYTPPKYLASIKRKNAFIDSLPDGLSDELYDSMAEDWMKELKPALEAEKMETAKTEAESYYSTPYDLIQKYQAEGRVYNKRNNSWSSPSVEHMLDSKEKAILARNKAHWAARHPNHHKPSELKVKYKGEWLTLNEHRQQLYSVPPNLIGKTHVISSYEDMMLRQAQIQAIKSGVALCRETNQLLMEAQKTNDEELISRYQAELKDFSQGVKNIKKQMRERQLDASDIRVQE